MYCTQCGIKLNDGDRFCPGCGSQVMHRAPVMEQTPVDKRSEIDRIADEIFWNSPVRIQDRAKYLSEKTGIPIRDAKKRMAGRYDQWKKDMKTGKYPDTQYCPYCASQDIEPYEEPGITVTSKANVLGGMYISSSAPSSRWMRCGRCGCSWRPKKRK